MDKLNSNWITEGFIDFEYKKYILLDYLQSTQKYFNAHKLFPFLSDLLQHRQNLITIRDQKQFLEGHLPKDLSGFDFRHYKINYTPVDGNTEHLQEIENIIEFALPKISDQILIAKNIYDETDHHLEIATVGIVPFYFNEGYLLFRTDGSDDTLVYQYELSIFENNQEQYRGLKTLYRETYPTTLYNYDESIKSQLIRKYKSLPNPATFVLHSKVNYPFQETLLPVAKRSFVRFLSHYQA